MIDDYRPARRHPDGLKCACCLRVFNNRGTPAPMTHGRYAGRLVCRDCRDALAEGDNYRTPLF